MRQCEWGGKRWKITLMNVLLDEDMPHPFRHHLPGHDVWTVDYMGWKGTVNDALFALARDDLDVLGCVDNCIKLGACQQLN